MSQQNLGLKSKATGSVECLGQTFPNEEVRREHFLKLLAEKLKDPEFRKIEGFPIGKDEDILALSDPPFYTACPNPWIEDFIKHNGTPYDAKKLYHREPFAADVSEGKNHPIYNAHSYHTKVPHRAIMRYILHYTDPGDLVFDGFAGTGMTGVAAQLCGDSAEVQELGYRSRADGIILDGEGKTFSKLGARRAILNDLSPAATFIAYNYNKRVNAREFELEARRILDEVEREHGWMYCALHDATETEVKTAARSLALCKSEEACRSLLKDGTSLKNATGITSSKLKLGKIDYTVWSAVFSCSECGSEIIFRDAAVDETSGKVLDEFPCPQCKALLTKRRIEPTKTKRFDATLNTTLTQDKITPTGVFYSVGGGRIEKAPDEFDDALLKKIEEFGTANWFPSNRMPEGDESRRNDPAGITHVHHFYATRALAILSALLTKSRATKPFRQMAICHFLFEQWAVGFSKLNRYSPHHYSQNNRNLSGTLYIGSQLAEVSPAYALEGKLRRLAKAFADFRPSAAFILSTGSSTVMRAEASSVDYIFVDPPFGGNLPYSALNFFWESWLRVVTNNEMEAITNKQLGRELPFYQKLMGICFRECFRLLKPGRWMTIEFSNTQASVWNVIQTTLQEAGFVVANVSALDKQSGSFKAVTTTTAVKQDLVISAYKPNGGLEERFTKSKETPEGVWDFIKTHLKNLPIVKARGGQLEFIAERDPRILYDRMIAFYIGHWAQVPLNSAEFQVGLADKFPMRDEMVFLPDQVNEYDKKRQQMESIGQLSIFVEDEKSAIAWLRSFLKDRPSVYSDITPDFMQQLNASWKKWETRPELSSLLEQNFLRYESGEVPSQIHSYLSTQFKELRNLANDHQQLRNKAKERWYVPDPKKNIDVESMRNKRLLEEFWTYLPAGYSPPALNPNRGDSLPGLTVSIPKIPKGKKLKELRTEAVRVGFKHCYQQKDYQTILVVAEMLPESVIQEDEALQMYYDTAVTRTGGD
jgi:DNA modification methylase/predicted RNA-binding Zn-ribbon protein involved in translation (DUF1610 family)